MSTSLLHLDARPKFVEPIKLAVRETGLGKERIRAPHLTLAGAEREAVREIIHDSIAPDVWVAYEFTKPRSHHVKLGFADRTEIDFFDSPRSIDGKGTCDNLHKVASMLPVKAVTPRCSATAQDAGATSDRSVHREPQLTAGSRPWSLRPARRATGAG